MQSSRPLRLELRSKRRLIRPRIQRAHAISVADRLASSRAFLSASRIAFYWPADGELDPRPLMHTAYASGKQCYLPVLCPIRITQYRGKLWFARHLTSRQMRPNRFGIPEPTLRGRHLLRPLGLDLLIMPLVGFDAQCHRIGMGGGFYDRTLGYLRHRRHWQRPRLIGIAHDCQRLEHIEPRPWDIQLDAVVTEEGIHARQQRGTGTPQTLI